jgi:hypothetical protein
VQKWEYLAAWVHCYSQVFKVPKQGLFGGSETRVEETWAVKISGEELALHDGLARLGDEGWEMVGVAAAFGSMQFILADDPEHPDRDCRTAHWLYLKRPKP